MAGIASAVGLVWNWRRIPMKGEEEIRERLKKTERVIETMNIMNRLFEDQKTEKEVLEWVLEEDSK